MKNKTLCVPTLKGISTRKNNVDCVPMPTSECISTRINKAHYMPTSKDISIRKNKIHGMCFSFFLYCDYPFDFKKILVIYDPSFTNGAICN